eukprot:scaffold1309_cov214-Chaetoceros_neogracile.AAC.9
MKCKSASAENRTRGPSLATMDFTTKPLMLDDNTLSHLLHLDRAVVFKVAIGQFLMFPPKMELLAPRFLCDGAYVPKEDRVSSDTSIINLKSVQ